MISLIQLKIGDSPHPSNVVNIGSEARRIAGNHVAVYPERLVNYFIQGSTDPGDIVLHHSWELVRQRLLQKHLEGITMVSISVMTMLEQL